MRLLSRFEDKKVGKYGLFAIVAVAILALLWSFIGPARAEGVARKGKLAASEPAATKLWTGVYLGGFGSYATGTVGDSGPIDLSATGPMAGLVAGVNVQTGQVVWGFEVAHAWAFGDLKDVGVDTETEYTGRAGVLWNQRTLLYGFGTFAQIRTDFGDVEGWKAGVGVESKTPMEGWSLDLRGGYSWYDVEGIHPDLEANILFVRLGLNKRFDLPAGWLGQ